MQVKAQLAQNAMNSHNIESQWQGNLSGLPSIPTYPSYMNPISPQSSLESVELNSADSMNMQEIQSRDEFSFQGYPKKRPCNSDLGELQALALRMMRNWTEASFFFFPLWSMVLLLFWWWSFSKRMMYIPSLFPKRKLSITLIISLMLACSFLFNQNFYYNLEFSSIFCALIHS